MAMTMAMAMTMTTYFEEQPDLLVGHQLSLFPLSRAVSRCCCSSLGDAVVGPIGPVVVPSTPATTKTKRPTRRRRHRRNA